MHDSTFAPKAPFTKDELEYIKRQNNPDYNKDLVEKYVKESFGVPDIIDNKDQKKYPINVINNPEGEIKEITQAVSIDPNTGNHTVISEEELNEKVGSDISLDEIEDFDMNSVNLTDSDAESIQALFGTNIEDSISFLNIMKDVRAGNDKNLFSRLPKIMRQQLVGTAGTTNIAVLNKLAKEFMDMALSQIGTDQAFVDLETGIINATDELMNGYKELAKESIEIENDDYKIRLKLYIDKLKNETPEKIEEINKWEAVRDRYLAAVDFSELKEAIIHNPKLSKKLDKYNRMVRDFNYKYSSETKKTKFVCRDVNFATNILARILDPKEYSNDTIQKFICIFCKYVKNYDATNIIDHTYMYFTIKTIVNLETLHYNEERYINTISSIKEILDIIKEAK